MSVKVHVVSRADKGRYELASDFSLIENRFAGDGKAFEAFKEAMVNRSYGRDALNTAWCWFLDGWRAAKVTP